MWLGRMLQASLSAISYMEKEDAMPQSHRYGRTDELPATLRRSCRQAQETFTAALSDAILAYGEGDKALRAAYAALKQKFEKRGDNWVAIPVRRTSLDGRDAAMAVRVRRPEHADQPPADRSPSVRVEPARK